MRPKTLILLNSDQKLASCMVSTKVGMYINYYNLLFRGCHLNTLNLNDSYKTQSTFSIIFFGFVTWPPFDHIWLLSCIQITAASDYSHLFCTLGVFV